MELRRTVSVLRKWLADLGCDRAIEGQWRWSTFGGLYGVESARVGSLSYLAHKHPVLERRQAGQDPARHQFGPE
jgi:hypothetical protein